MRVLIILWLVGARLNQEHINPLSRPPGLYAKRIIRLPVASCVFPWLLGYLNSRSVGASHFSHRPPGRLSTEQHGFSHLSVTHNSQMRVVAQRVGEKPRRILPVLLCDVPRGQERQTWPHGQTAQRRMIFAHYNNHATYCQAQTVWAFGCAEWCNLHIWPRFLCLNTLNYRWYLPAFRVTSASSV